MAQDNKLENKTANKTAVKTDGKAKYTDKQKRKAVHVEAGYRKRGVPKKAAAERAWRTVNKLDGGGKKPGGSGRGEHKTEPTIPGKGSTVRWNNGAGRAIGKVLQVFRRKITKTLKGTKVTRNATPEKPAMLVRSEGGGEALHSASELKRAPALKRGKKSG